MNEGTSLAKYMENQYRYSSRNTKYRQAHSRQEPKRMYKQRTAQRVHPDIPTPEEIDNAMLPPELRSKKLPVPEHRKHLVGLELETKHRYGDDIDILRREFTRTPEEVRDETFKLAVASRTLMRCIHNSCEHAPKKEVYRYAVEVKTVALRVHTNSIAVKRRYFRKNLLEMIDIDLDILRDVYWNISQDYTDWVTPKHLDIVYENINRVGKILGGLLKTTVV